MAENKRGTAGAPSTSGAEASTWTPPEAPSAFEARDSRVLTVIARYSARPGRGDKVAEVLAKHALITRTEPGCQAFVVARAIDDADRFILFEQYDDESAFQHHRHTSHFKHYIENCVVPQLEERHWLRLVEHTDGQ